MGSLLRCVSVLGVAVAAAASAGASTSMNANVPIRLGCPAQGERVGLVGASFADEVAAAQRALYREVTNYQGRRERRTSTNTPVVAVVRELGHLTPPRVGGQRQLLARATTVCGGGVARHSSAVMFDDGLTPVCCLPPITLFVVRTDRNMRVYRSPQG